MARFAITAYPRPQAKSLPGGPDVAGLGRLRSVVKATWEAHRYELELVAAQNEIAHPRDWFDAWVAAETE